METVIRQRLGIGLDPSAVREKLHITEDFEDEFSDIFDECAAIADPKFCYTASPVRQEEGYTYIGNERFDSRIMQVNFKGLDRVWPYVVTCGRELYDLAQ